MSVQVEFECLLFTYANKMNTKISQSDHGAWKGKVNCLFYFFLVFIFWSKEFESINTNMKYYACFYFHSSSVNIYDKGKKLEFVVFIDSKISSIYAGLTLKKKLNVMLRQC